MAIVNRRGLAEHLGLSPFQIAKVWPRWLQDPRFPGPAPGFSNKYNTVAFDRFLDPMRFRTAASDVSSNPRAVSDRLAAAAQVIGDRF